MIRRLRCCSVLPMVYLFYLPFTVCLSSHSILLRLALSHIYSNCFLVSRTRFLGIKCKEITFSWHNAYCPLQIKLLTSVIVFLSFSNFFSVVTESLPLPMLRGTLLFIPPCTYDVPYFSVIRHHNVPASNYEVRSLYTQPPSAWSQQLNTSEEIS